MNENFTEKIVTVDFSITHCPHNVHKRFVEFCKKESNNNYSFGIKLLLDGLDGNIKEALLYEQYLLLKARIDILEKKINKGDK